MPLPPAPQKGSPIIAWARLAWAWMRSTRPVAGPGILLRTSPSGTVISVADANRRKDPPPFHPRRLRRIGEDAYAVTIQPGWLSERVTRAGEPDAVVFHEPLIDPAGEALSLHAVPRPTLELAVGDSAWLRYQTFDTGDIDTAEDIEILAAASAASTHHQPKNPDESEGTRGDYYVRLFELEEDESGAMRLKLHQQSDVEHYHELWTGQNVGTGARIFKQRDHPADVYQFRSVRGHYGIDETEDDTIDLDLDAATLGSGEPVYLPEGHPDKTAALVAEFRSIAAGDPGRDQIEVYRRDAGTVGVRGNAMDGSLRFEDCAGLELFTLTWEDGLITSPAGATIVVPDCPGTT